MDKSLIKNDLKANLIIISDDRLYCRMLELEFLESGYGCKSFLINEAAVEKRTALAIEITEYSREINCCGFILNAAENDVFFWDFLKSNVICDVESVFFLGTRQIISKAEDRILPTVFENINFYERPVLIENFLSDVKNNKKTSLAEKRIVKNNGFEINESEKTVFYNGQKIGLAKREFELFLYMNKKSGLQLGRNELFSNVWGTEFTGDSNIVDVYIRRLRRKIDRKLGIEVIVTVRGGGYMVKK